MVAHKHGKKRSDVFYFVRLKRDREAVEAGESWAFAGGGICRGSVCVSQTPGSKQVRSEVEWSEVE
jgi:hypothetical protein